MKDFIKSKKWVHEVTRIKTTPFDWYNCVKALKDFENETSIKIDTSGILFYNNMYCYSQELIDNLINSFEKKLDNKLFWLNLAQKIEERCNNLIKIADSVDITKKEDQIKLIESAYSNKVFWPIVDILPNWWMKKFNIKPQNPIKQNFITKYIIDSSNLSTKKNYDEFLNKYSWMGVFHLLGDRFTKDQIIKESTFNLITLNNLNYEPKTDDEKIVSYYTYLATHMPESQMYHAAKIIDMFEHLDMSKEVLRFMLPHEIISLINGNKNFDIKKIKNRIKGFLIIRINELIFLECEKYEKLKKEVGNLFEFENNQYIFVKGIIANKGYAKGKACIVKNNSDFYRFKEGDILIAPSTTPNYVQLMAKASAFVTNEGGLSSHAAVISREMNKPCIVGTKIATKVFKDNDLIEVDADKGVVRKIK
jgi:phosphoenolpyruvate synthase/pyruvate phosphate dikinase